MTDERINDIVEMAKYLFGADDIAIILDMDPADLDEPDARRAMDRGRLLAQAEVRKSIYNMAKAGSTTAQKEFLKLAAEQAPNMLPAPTTPAPLEPGEVIPQQRAALDISSC